MILQRGQLCGIARYFQNRKVLITNLNLFDSYSLQGSRLIRVELEIRSNLSIADMLYSGHFFVEPAESRSNSHRKTPIQWTILQRTIVTADTIHWHHMKSSSQIYLFTADTLYFLWENKRKLLFNFQFFVFDNFLSLYIW